VKPLFQQNRLLGKTLALLGILSMALVAAGQVFMRGGVGFRPMIPAAAAADAGNSVYVRDSTIAMEKLALARRMEKAREWSKSADVYQEILQKYSDRVVEKSETPQMQYVSVTEMVREAICHWPAEGLAVYRSLYETTAAQLLAAGGTDHLDKLHEVMGKYFATDSAKAAGIRLMDIYFEQGDYSADSQIGAELLNWHPNLSAERPMVLYRTALAAKLAGQNDEADHWLNELKNQFPQATGSVRSGDVLLADSLAKELSSASIVRGQETDSWLTVGGNESRSKVCDSTVKPGARLYSIRLMRFNWDKFQDNAQRQQMENNDKEGREKGEGLGIMPAVDNGQLFFQDNTRIYALDLDGGVPLPAWVETYPMENGAFKLTENATQVTPVPVGRQLCVSVNDRYVTAVMGMPDLLAPQGQPSGQDSRLVCLDRATGKELWNTTMDSLPESQSALRSLQMCGAPLMVGDNLYVMVHGHRGLFDDCYVACFGLSDGLFRWATFIANSSNDPELGAMTDDLVQYSDPISHIAYAGGRLFVETNNGAVAALDAYTGTIAWLDIYRTDTPQTGTPMNAAMMQMARAQAAMNASTATVPWVFNPAVVEDGKVFILPSDSPNLFVYNAADGNLIKQIQLSALQEDAGGTGTADIPTTLLGVRGDLVYLAGDREVWQVPWQDIGKFQKVNDTPRYWRSTDSSTDDQSAQEKDVQDRPIEVRGRGFVTADAVYLPTKWCLRRIALTSGLLDPRGNIFPKNGWEEGQEGPGNVVVTQDHVVIAGDEEIAVYTDVALAKAKLDRAVADAPTDPDARLHYAEVMFAAAQPDVALQRLQEGFQLLGGTAALRIGPSRDRAFNDALGFAKRLVEKNGDPALIEQFFDLAKSAAYSVIQQVSYRLSRGDYDWNRANRDAEAAIELYQQILAEPAYRAVEMPDPTNGASTRAGVVAEKEIKVILGTPDGVLAFKKYEDAAQQKLQDARAAGDPDQMLAIAQTYPDAKVALEAMMAAAQVYESRANPRMATQVLRQLLQRVEDHDRVAVLEALARNYLRMPNHIDVAVSRLALAASLAPGELLEQPLVLPNGGVLQNVSLSTARDSLERYESQLSLESLPDMHLPTHDQAEQYGRAHKRWMEPFLADTPETTITGVDAMLVPMDDFSRNDRVIAWTGAGELLVYAVGQSKPVFQTVAVNQTPIGAAWLGPNLLVWSAASLTLLDGTLGQPKWSVDLATLPAIVNAGDAAADQDQAADGTAQTGADEIWQVRPTDDRIVVGTTGGRLFAIDESAGRVVWQTRTGGQASPLLANDDFTVARVQNGQSVDLQVYNTFSGEVVGKKMFQGDQGVVPINVALATDGTLVYTLPSQICIQDLFEANNQPQGMEPGITKDADAGPQQVQAIYQGAGQPEPDQLLIYGGRVFVVANSGKEVRVYSIDTGDPWQYHGPGQVTVKVPFVTNSNSANVRLHISGNYLYAYNPRNIVAYRIDPPTEKWDDGDDAVRLTNYQQMLFGKDYVCLVDRPAPPIAESNRPGSKLTLNFFIRHAPELPPEKESGLLTFQPELKIEGDNYALQPVEGGIAYFTGRTIHELMGARDFSGN
jgi:outer membrane protein assembly factor BamB